MVKNMEQLTTDNLKVLVEDVVDNFLEKRLSNPDELDYDIEHILDERDGRVEADTFIMFDKDSHIFGIQKLMDDLFENLPLVLNGDQEDCFSLCGSDGVNTIGFVVEVDE